MIALLQNTLLWVAMAVGAVIMLVLCLLYDGLIDDPAVVREAREQYIKVSAHEKVKAERDEAQKLLALEAEIADDLRFERDADRRSLMFFNEDLAHSMSLLEEMDNEIEQLEASPGRNELPTLGDLNLRLRNR